MSIDERISEALRRLVAGMGAMRIPADPCDADLVLSDVQTELATLRTQLATVTRERDSWRAQRDEVHAEMERQTQLKREERQAKLDAMRERDERQKALEVALEERTSALAERNWANERHDEARADAARLREALRTAMAALEEVARRTSVGPPDPPGPKANAWYNRLVELSVFARAALASVPSAEPTPRDMRIAEAVREACVETADASDEVSRRVAGDLRDLNLAAVVAKVVGA